LPGLNSLISGRKSDECLEYICFMNEKSRIKIYSIATLLTVFSVISIKPEIHDKMSVLIAIFVHLFFPSFGLIFSFIGLTNWRNEERNFLSILMILFCLIDGCLLIKTILFLSDSSNFNIM